MALLETVLDSPLAVKILEELKQRRADQQRHRQIFRASLVDQDRSEFINGHVVRRAPSMLMHSLALGRIIGQLGALASIRQCGVVCFGVLVCMSRNDYQPDLSWWGPGKAAAFSNDTDLFPPPDLVVEVLSSETQRIDRGLKFDDYADHGVAEYWIVDPSSQTIEQYLLNGGRYERAEPETTGRICSRAIGGFEFAGAIAFNDGASRQAMVEIMSHCSG